MSAKRRTKEQVDRRANEAAESAFVRAGVKSDVARPEWMDRPELLPRKPPGWKREEQS